MEGATLCLFYESEPIDTILQIRDNELQQHNQALTSDRHLPV